MVLYVFLKANGNNRELHVLTHSCPARRASDIPAAAPSNTCGPRRNRPAEGLYSYRSKRQLIRLPTAPRTIRFISTQERRWSEECMFIGCVRWLPASSRSEEHTSELQSLLRISYAVFFLNKHNTLCYVSK